MRRIILLSATALVLSACTQTKAPTKPAAAAVQTAPASSTDSRRETGNIKGYDTATYRFTAQAGAPLDVRLEASNRFIYMNILANNGDTLFNGASAAESNRYQTTAPYTGEYTVSVYLMRNAARRSERSRFELQIN